MSRLDLLESLRGHMAERSVIPKLTEAGYMRGHVAFEASSDQQAAILAWLTEYSCAVDAPRLAMASIGSGSGILDVPMLQGIASRRGLDYLAVEPFAEQCQAFENRLAKATGLGDTRVEIVQATLEELQTERRFHRVLAVHSIYYVPELAAALSKMRELTAKGGEMMIAVAPFEDMNRLAEVFWGPQQVESICFEKDVVDAVEDFGAEMAIERIDAELIFDPEGPEAGDIISFLIQCPLEDLHPPEVEAVFSYLHEVGEERGDRLAVPHPVSMIRLRV